jgi:hypothetical protein
MSASFWPRIHRNDLRQILLHIIRREGGEWTVGRCKPVYRRIVRRHVYRATIRRDLAALHAGGHLQRHGDGTPRRFYTYCTKGGTA